MTKLCSICKNIKVYTDFHSNRLTKDGYGSQCKECAKKEKVRLNGLKKQEIIARLGGECEICGYNKNFAALEFHHRDTKNKEFSLAASRGLSLEKLLEEAKKCQLLCCRCHRELHNPSLTSTTAS